jgi:uncharacterized delta-60 repeat protein
MKTFFFLPLLIFSFVTNAQPGTLDNTFGNGGKISTGFRGNAEDAEAVVIQSDGKIVALGSSGCENCDTLRPIFALARYNKSDGSLDNTFGNGGKVTSGFGWGFYYGRALALQSDGKIVAAGMRLDSSQVHGALVIARYNTNGSLDNTFGSAGVVITTIQNNHDAANAVAIQSDGKIVAAGGADSNGVIVRYNSNGSLDNSFGTGGIALSTAAGFNTLDIQSDGKILAAGAYNQFFVQRYNSNGTLDNSFGTGGTATTDFGGANSLAIQSDGRVVVVGYSGSDIAMARFNSDGSLDNNFGSGGKVTSSFSRYGCSANACTIQSDGKIIVGGYVADTSYGAITNFAIARYNSDGSLDNSFGNNGVSLTLFYFGDDVHSVVLQADGKIVAAGSTGYTDGSQFILARYNNDSPLGITVTNGNESLVLSPNPSAGIFSLTSHNNTQKTICIYDAMGQCVKRFSTDKLSQYTIDISDQPKGIYFIELISRDQKQIGKIVLQ